MSPTQTIATRIRSRRIALGFSQGEACRIGGIHPTSWSRWECGVQVPDQVSLVRVADALRMSTDRLLGRSTKKRKKA